MSWFYELSIDHQVELLANPHHLSDELAGQIESLLSPGSWSGSPMNPTLDALVLTRLDQVRAHLDNWWELLTGPPLPNNERDYLIAHRADAEPQADYTKLVHDEATSLGERPAMVEAYIKMKARESDN